jgi:two-component system CheB/CheR fusion protein
LREAVVFARQNLISDAPFSRMDLISCRNLLIYLEPELQKKAIRTFHYALKPQGYLFLGASESIGASTNLFEQSDKRHKIYARKAAPTPPVYLPARHLAAERLTQAQRPPAFHGVPPQNVRGEVAAQREADRLTINRFSPVGVLINADFEILQFRGPTGAYLAPPTGMASFNVLKMARENLMLPLRAAINKAKKENKTVRKENVQVQTNGKPRSVNVEVIPLKNLKERSFLILFEDTRKLDRPVPKPEAQQEAPVTTRAAGKKEELHRIAELESELAETRDYLQSTQEQHEAAHEELQASSEEAESANEELQSVNEELETSKEELESANEELITVNEEMSTRNDTLSRLNSDLTNLQTSTNLAIVLLGRDLSIRRFSVQAEKLLQLTAADIGASIRRIRHNLVFEAAQSSGIPVGRKAAGKVPRHLSAPDLESFVVEVIASLHEREREVQDSEGRWYSLRVRPYMTMDNKVDGAVLVLVDIDDLKRSFMAVAMLGAIVDSSDDAIIGTDHGGFITSWNSSARRLFGYTAQEAIGQSLTALIPPQGRHEEQIILACIQRGERADHIETVRTKKDGSQIEVSLTLSPIKDDSGKVIGASKIVRDIGQRKRAERELAEKARLLDLTNDAIIVCDGKNRIRLWNKAAETTFGWTFEEVAGKDLHTLLRTEFTKPLEEIIAQLQRKGRFNGEITQTARDGRRVLSLCGWVLDRGTGSILTSYTDITERKKTEEALQHSQAAEVTAMAQSENALKEADARKDEFLAMLAHELRNPLGPIGNSIHLLSQKLPDKNEEIARLLDMLQRQTAHLTHLIGDLLDVSRVSRGKISLHRARTDLRKVVRTTVEDHRKTLEKSGLSVVLSLPDASVWMDGDETRLSQALTNLLHNANKFTKAGGSVDIKLVHDDARKLAILSVRDTGEGIEPGLLPRLFDAFIQGDSSLDRKHGGLGLGLALTKGLIEMHGGTVKASSEGSGKGSEFVIELPVDSSQMLKAVSTPKRPAAVAKRRVLIIEDNVDVAESMRMLLAINGHTVSVAGDGQTGISLAEKMSPEIIFCDIGLPGSMNGYAVAEEIRRMKTLRGVHLVALTGYGQPEDIRRAEAAGFNLHLIKPVEPSVLEDVIAKIPPPQSRRQSWASNEIETMNASLVEAGPSRAG